MPGYCLDGTRPAQGLRQRGLDEQEVCRGGCHCHSLTHCIIRACVSHLRPFSSSSGCSSTCPPCLHVLLHLLLLFLLPVWRCFRCCCDELRGPSWANPRTRDRNRPGPTRRGKRKTLKERCIVAPGSKPGCTFQDGTRAANHHMGQAWRQVAGGRRSLSEGGVGRWEGG